MILQNKYSRDDFLAFQKQFLPDFTKDVRSVDRRGLQVTKDVVQLGYSDQLDLKIFEFTHASSTDPRVSLTRDGFRVMKDSATYLALAAYHSEKSDDWRLSLMVANLEINEKGRVKQSFSDPRRYSFFLGPDAKMHTPEEFLVKQGVVKDIKNLISRFDVEVVTIEFFTKYKQLFDDLHNLLSKDNEFIKFSNENKVNIDSFAKKVLGQIVFCYFLQKKGWLGALKGKNVNEGKKDFMRWFFNKRKEFGTSFYNDCLEHLFYDALNMAPDKEGELYRDYLGFQVPFLNGGLFEPIQNYDWKESFLHIPDITFSNKEKTGILDVFDLYNFTVYEDDPVDREVSVDPEMLGKVFEKLLPENLRKGQGAYYTPREIVHYMCQESLINYLIAETNFDEDHIRKLIISKDRLFTNNGFVVSASEAEKLDKALANIKVCDPACGSGAFLVGMLHEVVAARRILNPKRHEYRIKIEAIQNSIFGVDIDSGAAEIAKLRLWLSLVVDYEIADIEPLPNLDFKIICANSLIPLASEEQAEIGDDPELERKMKSIRDRYFNTSSLRIKEKLKEDFEKLLVKNRSLFVSEKQKQLLTYHPFNESNVCSFFDSKFIFGIDGFDIVIANPPFVDSETMVKNEKENRNLYTSIYKSAKGNWDLFIIFIERGINVLKPNGIISYIVPNKLIAASYSEELRKLLSGKNIKELRDFSMVKVFKDVSVYPIVFRAQNNCKKDHVLMVSMSSVTDVMYENRISPDVFYQDLFWDRYFTQKGVLNIIFKISRFKPLSSHGFLVLGAATVTEAYEFKKYLIDENKDNLQGYKKLINTGTLDPYLSLWGLQKTQYINDSYVNPIISDKDIIKINPTRYEQAKSKKIIIGGMTKEIEGYYDEGDYLAGKSTSIILQNSSCDMDLKILLCFLNSKVVSFWYMNYYKSLSLAGGYLRINNNEIKTIPIPNVGLKEQKQLIGIDDAIIKLTQSNDYMSNDTKQVKVEEYKQQVDQIVYELYSLTDDEIKIVENE